MRSFNAVWRSIKKKTVLIYTHSLSPSNETPNVDNYNKNMGSIYFVISISIYDVKLSWSVNSARRIHIYQNR